MLRANSKQPNHVKFSLCVLLLSSVISSFSFMAWAHPSALCPHLSLHSPWKQPFVSLVLWCQFQHGSALHGMAQTSGLCKDWVLRHHTIWKRLASEDLWLSQWKPSFFTPPSYREMDLDQPLPSDKDIQSNVLSSRSPPDLTSHPLTLPSQKLRLSLRHKNGPKLRARIRFARNRKMIGGLLAKKREAQLSQES